VKRALLILLATSAGAAYGEMDLKGIVEQSIRNYERDWRAACTGWAYTQTDTMQSDGTKEIDVSEVVPLAGTPYERLLSKDGRPLSAAAQRKEDRKYEHVLRQREAESASEREARIRKYENERSFIKDIPAAYDFKLLGDEVVDGRPAWVIAMTPRAGFVPSTPRGPMLSHLEGKLWIDKEDLQWAKAESTVIDTIGVGWILARIERGTRFTVEQTRVENGLWMPRRITITGAAEIMMVHSKPLNEELVWSGYRRDSSASADRISPSPVAPDGSKSFR